MSSTQPNEKIHWVVLILAVSATTLIWGTSSLPLNSHQTSNAYLGVASFMVLGFVAWFSADLLARSWLVFLEMRPECYENPPHNPLTEMIREARGPAVSKLLSGILVVAQFAFGLLYVELATRAFYGYVNTLGSLSMCYVRLIEAALTLIQATMKSVRQLVISFVLILIFAGTVMGFMFSAPQPGWPKPVPPSFDFKNYAQILSTMLIMVGVHGILPTLFKHVAQTAHIRKGVLIGFTSLIILLAAYTVALYGIFGGHVYFLNVTICQQHYTICWIMHLFRSVGLLYTVPVIMLPLYNQLEQLANIPADGPIFGARGALRAVVQLALCAVSILLPNSPPICYLVLGGLLPLLMFAVPPSLYLCLKWRHNDPQDYAAAEANPSLKLPKIDKPTFFMSIPLYFVAIFFSSLFIYVWLDFMFNYYKFATPCATATM